MTKTFDEYQQEKREREWNEKVRKQKESMGNAERVKRATEWKTRGNDKFKAGNLHEARDYYREAIVYVEDLVDARRKERNDLLMPLYANLSQVQLRLEEPVLAEEVAGKGLAIAENPRNVVTVNLRAKCQFRRGVARKLQGKLEEARDDFVAALKLQPESEEVSKELSQLRTELANRAKEARAVMGGFLNREASKAEKREEDKQRQKEKMRLAEEKRKERKARAEQRQQMQEAFAKLSKGEMLYEAREKEMEPIRKKEEEKRQTIELEKNLMNIIDSSKGKPKVEDYDEFVKQKEARAWEQSDELDQKKKVLDKLKKEEEWSKDDVWREGRIEHRKQIEARGSTQVGAKAMWEAREVGRWCEQRLREVLVKASVDMEDELDKDLATVVKGEDCGPCVLRALITDVLKLEGDASVLRLNKHKPPLHYFDYFLKMEWEVAVVEKGKEDEVYRTADELISAAAASDDMKAPASIAKNRVFAGTFKTREFSSEEIPADGKWPLMIKVKKPVEKEGRTKSEIETLEVASQKLRDRLLAETQQILCSWITEYQEYWTC
eukprot:TRINITY_DN10319_c0_g1_i5.p1 TRINITY_DN10319_c0_g1~~TRINITY_DN10319_c0_g1_i5.p1  ORF type:complete len:552 (+),score=167.13 TRINITY_DN10319_c0_g1_i5:40-1695(+)